jgi:hypothetical protein
MLMLIIDRCEVVDNYLPSHDIATLLEVLILLPVGGLHLKHFLHRFKTDGLDALEAFSFSQSFLSNAFLAEHALRLSF